VRLTGFCRNLQNVAAAVTNCTLSLIDCPIPQSLLFPAPTVFDSSYAPSLGVFPVNAWGMTTIFNYGSTACSRGAVWSNPVFNVNSNVSSVASITVATTTAAPAGARQSGSTPYRAPTPKSSSRAPTPTTRNDKPTTPRKQNGNKPTTPRKQNGRK